MPSRKSHPPTLSSKDRSERKEVQKSFTGGTNIIPNQYKPRVWDGYRKGVSGNTGRHPVWVRNRWQLREVGGRGPWGGRVKYNTSREIPFIRSE